MRLQPSRLPAPAGVLLSAAFVLCAGSQLACQEATPKPPATQLNTKSLVLRLEEAYRQDPCRWQPALELAQAYREDDASDKAVAIYQALLACSDPAAQGIALNALARLEAERQDPAKAADYLWKSTSAGDARTQSQAWFLLGELIRQEQRVPEQFLEAPDGSAPLVSAAATPTEAAEIALVRAIDTGQPAPDVFRALAELAVEQGALRQGLEEYQVYLAGNPGDMLAWQAAAQVAYDLGDLETARFCLEMVLSKGSETQRESARALLVKLPAATEPVADQVGMDEATGE